MFLVALLPPSLPQILQNGHFLPQMTPLAGVRPLGASCPKKKKTKRAEPHLKSPNPEFPRPPYRCYYSELFLIILLINYY